MSSKVALGFDAWFDTYGDTARNHHNPVCIIQVGLFVGVPVPVRKSGRLSAQPCRLSKNDHNSLSICYPINTER